MIENDLVQQRRHEVLIEMRTVIGIIANKMAIPLYLLFWIADIFYVPQLKWEFFLIRLTSIPICLLTIKLSKKYDTIEKVERVALFFAISLAAGINLMIYLIGDIATPYYAGLGLVALAALSFIPFSNKKYLLATIGIYLPYYIMAFVASKSYNQIAVLVVNTFFIISAVIICFLIRFFQESLRVKEIESRNKLNFEIVNRDSVIREKTDEAVKLISLSSQFSPQIIEAIKNGKINLEAGSGTRAQSSRPSV